MQNEENVGERLIDGATYHRNGYPWEDWRMLRRESPVHRFQLADGKAYWAVTRYKDIVEIESKPEVFENAPRMTMADVDGPLQVRMVVNMDPPDHPVHRSLVNPRFMPRSLEWLRPYVAEIVTETLDEAMSRNGEVVDFQSDVAGPVPTSVICRVLGVPRSLAPQMVKWTEETINPFDPSVSKGRSVEECRQHATKELFSVFAELMAERRVRPREDLLTALLNARLDGKAMPDFELLSWCFILVTAGHETTQSAFSLGIHALLQNPGELARLRKEQSLLESGVDELLRYVSPAIHFVRTPNAMSSFTAA